MSLQHWLSVDSYLRYITLPKRGIIGGYAVAVHGHPRYTKDIDIWVDMSPANTHNLISALTEFGFGSLGLTAEDFQTENRIVQLGYPPSRIDLITTPDGVDFQTCFDTKVEIKIDNITINFINLENLKRNKQASGRMQDLADIENLSE